MWERRYGFPLPARDAKGERAYSAEQVVRLRHLRRLVQTGHRPGQVVPLDESALTRLLAIAPFGSREGAPLAAREDSASLAAARPPAHRRSLVAVASQAQLLTEVLPHEMVPGHDAATTAHLAACLQCISSHDPVGLRGQLTRAILGLGLEACVLQLVAPLTQQVGQAWAEGRFAVYEEHFYTECVTGVLRAAIAGVPLAAESGLVHPGCPRILLTTAPREQHGLGLLMLEALLALRGCICLPLGTEMPIADIARAAQVFRSDVVALSFSGVLTTQRVRADLADLRRQLSPDIAIWAGGQGARVARGASSGVTVLRRLEDVDQALDQRATGRRAP